MHNKIIILYFLTLLFIAFNYQLKAQDCYELVWNDEFNYTGLPDTTMWAYEVGGSGWGNNELQYYTEYRSENARVENGHLIIEAREENYGGRSYTSARLITYPTNHSWKYGKIEARIKLPYGQGIWPAFWMLGDGIFEGNPWPGCGEIDIMEMVGGGEGYDDVVHGTMHYDDNGHSQYGSHYQLDQGIFADAFHTFSIEWTDTHIKWFVDDIQYHEATLTESYLSEFHEKFFILLNVAVGGNWPGSPDATTVFPQQMKVDYVRVYQKNQQPAVIGDTVVNKAQQNIIFKTVESDDFSYNWTVPQGATITTGQGTHQINVNWGCDSGSVVCEITGYCGSYTIPVEVYTEGINLSGNRRVETYATNTQYAIAALDSTAYSWQVPPGVSFTGTSDTNIVTLNWEHTGGYVKVTASNHCGTETDSLNVSVVQQLPYPDSATHHPIPGTIEAISYDFGGEGIAYHDTDTINEGTGSRQNEGVDTQPNDGSENIGWIQPGEWVEYSVDVDSTALYDIELRVASLPGGGQMEIHFNGQDRTGPVSIASTGSWYDFTSIYLDDIQLYESDTIMKLLFKLGNFNISRAIFNYNANGISGCSHFQDYLLYPNPVQNQLNVMNINNRVEFQLYSISGRTIKSGEFESKSTINLNHTDPGIYFLKIINNKKTHVLKFIKE